MAGGEMGVACPTGWHSVAASAPQQACQKTTDLAREAVGCNGVFGGPVHLSSSSHITEREGEDAMK
jgi:hypothetical protein